MAKTNACTHLPSTRVPKAVIQGPYTICRLPDWFSMSVTMKHNRRQPQAGVQILSNHVLSRENNYGKSMWASGSYQHINCSPTWNAPMTIICHSIFKKKYVGYKNSTRCDLLPLVVSLLFSSLSRSPLFSTHLYSHILPEENIRNLVFYCNNVLKYIRIQWWLSEISEFFSFKSQYSVTLTMEKRRKCQRRLERRSQPGIINIKILSRFRVFCSCDLSFQYY